MYLNYNCGNNWTFNSKSVSKLLDGSSLLVSLLDTETTEKKMASVEVHFNQMGDNFY